jgi:hypothetical protein
MMWNYVGYEMYGFDGILMGFSDFGKVMMRKVVVYIYMREEWDWF